MWVVMFGHCLHQLLIGEVRCLLQHHQTADKAICGRCQGYHVCMHLELTGKCFIAKQTKFKLFLVRAGTAFYAVMSVC